MKLTLFLSVFLTIVVNHSNCFMITRDLISTRKNDRVRDQDFNFRRSGRTINELCNKDHVCNQIKCPPQGAFFSKCPLLQPHQVVTVCNCCRYCINRGDFDLYHAYDRILKENSDRKEKEAKSTACKEKERCGRTRVDYVRHDYVKHDYVKDDSERYDRNRDHRDYEIKRDRVRYVTENRDRERNDVERQDTEGKVGKVNLNLNLIVAKQNEKNCGKKKCDKQEWERREKERVYREREDWERREREREHMERREKEREDRERLEKEREDRERREKERIERGRREWERIDRERREKERRYKEECDKKKKK